VQSQDTMMSVVSVGAMPVPRISLCDFADEELVEVAKRFPGLLAVNRWTRAVLLAQNGTENNPKLIGEVEVHKGRFHASNVHNKQERLLVKLEQKCSLYDVQSLTLAGLYRDIETVNLGRVLSLTPNLTKLSLKHTILTRASFADILVQLPLHTLDLQGNSAFIRYDNLVLPTALKSLNLGHCHVTDFKLRVLMRSVRTCDFTLTGLNLWGNSSLQQTTVLPELLSELTGLTSIRLDMTGLNGDKLVSVLSMLRKRCTNLQVLGLVGLPVIDPRKETFPKRLSKTQLAHRNVSNARYFEELKGLTGLEELYLNDFWVGKVHAEELAAALGVMSHLKSLNLSNTGLEWEGARLIATALAVLPLLEDVEMRDVEIGANGARAIRDAVSGRTKLVDLKLTGRNFR
jgi:hypothetical protein